jgi:hypothetical protein
MAENHKIVLTVKQKLELSEKFENGELTTEFSQRLLGRD